MHYAYDVYTNRRNLIARTSCYDDALAVAEYDYLCLKDMRVTLEFHKADDTLYYCPSGDEIYYIRKVNEY